MPQNPEKNRYVSELQITTTITSEQQNIYSQNRSSVPLASGLIISLLQIRFLESFQ